MKSHVSLGTTEQVIDFLAGLKANGCICKLGKSAGTATAMDGDTKVFAAIQKGRGGHWIMRFTESDRIKWTAPQMQKNQDEADV